jgi:isocitrate dehydrogenase
MNLYGDIISDIAAEISGSVGLAGSANIGNKFAMFEAIHGSAPDIANQNIANPTGLIQASVMMLTHINQAESANLIRNALYKTIEDGDHTPDIFNQSVSRKKVGTQEFADAVIKNLGKKPEKLAIASFKNNSDNYSKKQNNEVSAIKISNKKLIGFDLYIDWNKNFDELLNLLKSLESEKFELKMISAKDCYYFRCST